LYHPVFGYFSAQKRLIFTPNIPFTGLRNQVEYQQMLSAAYAGVGEAWCTPVELFQPVYGEALAHYIDRTRLPTEEPLHIVEIGGGTGTCARNVVDYFRRRRPDFYKNMRYTIVEISATLAALQRSRFNADEPVDVVNKSVFDLASQQRRHPCVFIALEVLDNLPQYVIGGWNLNRLSL
jgi:SAM-dependent MidA family methyltransferase